MSYYKQAIILLSIISVVFTGCSVSDVPTLPSERQTISSSFEPQTTSSSSSNNCPDFLSLYGEKPEYLELFECIPPTGEIVAFARYRVPGKNAAAVESFLDKKYNMGTLHYPACCTWETTFTGQIPIPGYVLSIIMHSDETKLMDKSEWRHIPYFYVNVQQLKPRS